MSVRALLPIGVRGLLCAAALAGCNDGASLGGKPDSLSSGGGSDIRGGSGGIDSSGGAGSASTPTGGASQSGGGGNGGAAGTATPPGGAAGNSGTAGGGQGGAAGGSTGGTSSDAGASGASGAGPAGSGGSSGGDGVTLTVIYTQGAGVMTAQWYNGTGSTIFLRGCATADGWYREGAEWKEYGGLAACAMPLPARELAPGSSYHDPAAGFPPNRGDNVWRLVGPYGTDCTAGVILEDADCAELHEATSVNEVSP